MGNANNKRHGSGVREALQKLLRSPSALSRARSSLAYLPDTSRDSLRGFAHLGLLATLLQSFLIIGHSVPRCFARFAFASARLLRANVISGLMASTRSHASTALA